MVGSLDRPVYSAVVGFQVGAYQDIVDSEIELVLIVGNPQPLAGVGECVVQLLGKDTVCVRDGTVVEVTACYNGRIFAFRDVFGNGICL